MKTELQEAIDNYTHTRKEIERLQSQLDNYKSIILSSIDPEESASGNSFIVTVGKPSVRFSGYSDPAYIISLLRKIVIPDECLKLNKSVIDKLIEQKLLPSSIRSLEVYKEQAPRITFQSANTWDDFFEELEKSQ